MRPYFTLLATAAAGTSGFLAGAIAAFGALSPTLQGAIGTGFTAVCLAFYHSKRFQNWLNPPEAPPVTSPSSQFISPTQGVSKMQVKLTKVETADVQTLQSAGALNGTSFGAGDLLVTHEDGTQEVLTSAEYNKLSPQQA